MTDDPVNIFGYEERARQLLPQEQYDYVAGGAADEITIRRARATFDAILLHTSVLAGVGQVDLGTTVLGHDVAVPVMVAPAGFHDRVHPDAEAATARAAAAAGSVMVLSASSRLTLEEVAKSADGVKWFQQFLYRDRALSAHMASRAAEAGYSAVCVTLDSPPFPPRRERNIRNKYKQLPSPNYAGIEIEAYAWGEGAKASRGSGELINHAATWDDLAWLVETAGLPVVAKGIMTARDAQRCVDVGVAGVVVSNHGGRNLDTTPATIEVLPRIADQVAGRAEVFLDGGVRRGTDVLKALALGARAVLVGRPLFWGLAVGGDEGLHKVLDILRDELAVAMSMCGQHSAAHVDRDIVALRSPLEDYLAGRPV